MITKRLDAPFVSEQMDNAGNQRQYTNQFNQPIQAQVNEAATKRYDQQAQLTMPEGYPKQHWDTLNGNEKADVVERAAYEKHMARLSTLDAKARRDRIAEMALQGLLAGGAHKDYGEAHIIAAAISYAENLIAELDRA